MPGYLSTTKARRKFKKKLGNANHLIITLLVGLEAVEKGLIGNAPRNLRAAWSPKNPVASADRSRKMLLDMTLVRAVDALDLYFRYASRKPLLFQQNEMQTELDKCNHSIFGKFQVVEKYYPQTNQLLPALIALMITWRNRAAHQLAEIQLKDEYRCIISENEQKLNQDFSGLEGDKLLGHYDNYEDPKFKEIASFMNVVQQYVKCLEQIIFEKLDKERYLKEVISEGILPRENIEMSRERERKQLIGSIWGKYGEDKKMSIIRFFRHQGIIIDENDRGEESSKISDALINKLFISTPKELRTWIDES